MRKKIRDFIVFAFLSALFCLIVYIILFSFIALRIAKQNDVSSQNVSFESVEEQIRSEIMIQGGLFSR